MKTKQTQTTDKDGNIDILIKFPYNIKQVEEDTIVVSSRPNPELGRCIENSVTNICKLAEIEDEEEMCKLDSLIQQSVLKVSILSGLKITFAK